MLQDIAPHRFHIEYADCTAQEGDILLCCSDTGIMTKAGADELCFPTVGEIAVSPLRYLFSIDDTRYFCADAPDCANALENPGFETVSVRSLRHAVPRKSAFAGAVGHRLWAWYRSSRFCGRCGSLMQHSTTERAMCCPECGNIVYPIICPSVIIAVKNGDKLLLTRYQQTHSAYRHHALCAGYIETGESAEDAVRRELMEEVGLRVKNIRYYKSQPWPFSGALLLGYFCEVDGDDTITRDDSELSEAVWFSRADMPVRENDVSLTSEMMERFRLGLE